MGGRCPRTSWSLVPTTLLCLQLIDANQRCEELNTQVQIEPALNFSDLYFRLVSLIRLGSVSWWPELLSQGTANERGLLHDHVVHEQGELHHALYNAVGQMYSAMSRADLNCARNFYNEWGLYWFQMTLRKLSAAAILPIPLCEHDQTSQWGTGTSALWVMLGAWALLPGWLWEVCHLVEVHLEYGAPNCMCVGSSTRLGKPSWPGSQRMGTMSSHSEPHVRCVSVTFAKDGTTYVKWRKEF